MRRGGRGILPGAGPVRASNKATLAAAAFLAGESEALTRRAVELALGGDPTAMRLCLERILPPCRERTIKFALPPIESAPTGQSPWAEGPRHRRGDEGGDLGAGQWGDHAGRGGEDRGGGRHLCPGRSMPTISTGACRNSKTRPRRAAACIAGVGVALAQQPLGEWFAADLLQMQQRKTVGSILDCKSRPWPLAGRHAFCDHSRRESGDDHRG
jgi:hypothetical protein